MTIIKDLLDSKQNFLYNLSKSDGKRYSYESYIISVLAQVQLNSDKNRVKGRFEDEEKLLNLYYLYISEVCELKHELLEEKINYERVLEEIGDCAAFLSGMIAWILEHKNGST